MRYCKHIILFVLLTSACFQISAGTPSASKKLKQAEKLVGDFSKVSTARKLFKEVLADTTYTPDARAYNIGARIEREAYNHYYKLLSINRKDPSVDRVAMSDALMDSYLYACKSIEIDSVPDKKGKISVKFSPSLSQWISESGPAMYNAGIVYLNKKLYYPKAYKAFLEFATLPEKHYYHPETPMGDSIRANAYYYGGVMAFKAAEYEYALSAFKEAEKHGYVRKELFLNQISALSNLVKTYPGRRDSLSREITKVSADGLKHYGVKETPVFIQKYVAGMLYEEQPEKALAALDTALTAHPKMLMLHTMKAGVLSTMDSRQEDAATAYKYAATLPDTDAATLKAASKFLARHGIELLDAVKGRGREARKRMKEIREKYLKPSLEYARRAIELLPNDPELQNTIETVSYRLH